MIIKLGNVLIEVNDLRMIYQHPDGRLFFELHNDRDSSIKPDTPARRLTDVTLDEVEEVFKEYSKVVNQGWGSFIRLGNYLIQDYYINSIRGTADGLALLENQDAIKHGVAPYNLGITLDKAWEIIQSHQNFILDRRNKDLETCLVSS